MIFYLWGRIRVLQKLIETLSTKEQISLVKSALKPGFLFLVKELNGNHVILSCLKSFGPNDNKLMIFYLWGRIRVLQKLIETLSTNEQISLVKSALKPGFLFLVKELNGNHVILSCLKSFGPNDNKLMIFCLWGRILVVRKLNETLSTKEQISLVKSALKPEFLSLVKELNGNNVILSVLKSFGPNHNKLMIFCLWGRTRVVQKLIETLSTKEQISLVKSALKPRFLSLVKELSGNHVILSCLKSFGPNDNKV
ncbi:hypothetical protein ARALYDRAFT_894316 [Arabidopsis lyrata subsp. lyrata]|uniref:PUM-HD domain-containing protein n=1 Tax=Arabidopsis lyrata subsp. lyrata TaxID=81972 RepID=D7KTS7_ARALL|nr:hypothetical protein ARALYDRAFT_894316 [Arabidopsis lyrata subsp. lyrata]